MKVYIKINEVEIVVDYFLLVYYKVEEEEIDEYIFFDDDNVFLVLYEFF